MQDSNQNDNAQQPEKSSGLSILNILGNAKKSSGQYDQTQAGVETKVCKSCGAARPEDTNLQFCDYCGYKFY